MLWKATGCGRWSVIYADPDTFAFCRSSSSIGDIEIANDEQGTGRGRRERKVVWKKMKKWLVYRIRWSRKNLKIEYFEFWFLWWLSLIFGDIFVYKEYLLVLIVTIIKTVL